MDKFTITVNTIIDEYREKLPFLYESLLLNTENNINIIWNIFCEETDEFSKEIIKYFEDITGDKDNGFLKIKIFYGNGNRLEAEDLLIQNSYGDLLTEAYTDTIYLKDAFKIVRDNVFFLKDIYAFSFLEKGSSKYLNPMKNIKMLELILNEKKMPFPTFFNVNIRKKVKHNLKISSTNFIPRNIPNPAYVALDNFGYIFTLNIPICQTIKEKNLKLKEDLFTKISKAPIIYKSFYKKLLSKNKNYFKDLKLNLKEIMDKYILALYLLDRKPNYKHIKDKNIKAQLSFRFPFKTLKYKLKYKDKDIYESKLKNKENLILKKRYLNINKIDKKYKKDFTNSSLNRLNKLTKKDRISNDYMSNIDFSKLDKNSNKEIEIQKEKENINDKVDEKEDEIAKLKLKLEEKNKEIERIKKENKEKSKQIVQETVVIKEADIKELNNLEKVKVVEKKDRDRYKNKETEKDKKEDTIKFNYENNTSSSDYTSYIRNMRMLKNKEIEFKDIIKKKSVISDEKENKEIKKEVEAKREVKVENRLNEKNKDETEEDIFSKLLKLEENISNDLKNLDIEEEKEEVEQVQEIQEEQLENQKEIKEEPKKINFDLILDKTAVTKKIETIKEERIKENIENLSQNTIEANLEILKKLEEEEKKLIKEKENLEEKKQNENKNQNQNLEPKKETKLDKQLGDEIKIRSDLEEKKKMYLSKLKQKSEAFKIKKEKENEIDSNGKDSKKVNDIKYNFSIYSKVEDKKENENETEKNNKETIEDKFNKLDRNLSDEEILKQDLDFLFEGDLF